MVVLNSAFSICVIHTMKIFKMYSFRKLMKMKRPLVNTYPRAHKSHLIILHNITPKFNMYLVLQSIWEIISFSHLCGKDSTKYAKAAHFEK